ncbi:MAG: type II toxin-antitoxin system RelE/ParE family toxin [Deltaproteobacteria bacterium]|nr:MAG: type II toxin-antitoxin system RelE/ParE family toxin [Deltaproteobacteria bacterium]
MKYDVITTDVFSKWAKKLKDRQAARAIALRIARVRAGNLGDVSSVGDNISEMRIFVGKGYRVYFTKRGKQLILLLCGGDKSTQQADIKRAKTMLKQLEGK